VTLCGAATSEEMPRTSNSSTHPQSSIRATNLTKRPIALLPSRTAGARPSRNLDSLPKKLIAATVRRALLKHHKHTSCESDHVHQT
jgi:hypothetical protein